MAIAVDGGGGFALGCGSKDPKVVAATSVASLPALWHEGVNGDHGHAANTVRT